MTGKRPRGGPASRTYERCKRHDTRPDADADMGRGCLYYDDHEDWQGVACRIGDIPVRLLRLPAEADA